MRIREEIVFKLKSKLEYQSGGVHYTKELLLRAPIAKHDRHVRKIQQLLTQCQLKTAQSLSGEAMKVQLENAKLEDTASAEAQEKPGSKKIDEKKEIEDQAEGFLTALKGGSQGTDKLFNNIEIFYDLFCDEICFIKGPNGDVPITRDLLNEIHFLERDQMVGEYIANFISP